MLYAPAKPDMGLIIRRRAGRLTLSRESRNKPEETGALKRTQLREMKAAAPHDESVECTLFAESQFPFELIV